MAEALEAPDVRERGSAAIRGLIEEIRLVPQEGALRIELVGELGALIALAQNERDEAGINDPRRDASEAL